MPAHIEIEFKTMLTEDEFHRLLKQLPFPERPVIQTNHYFETDDFQLKENGCALRIRKKRGQFILTLKEPHDEGLLETNEPLSKETADRWLEGNPTTTDFVSKRLKRLGIKEDALRHVGSLVTERYTFEENGIHYMLDKSLYHGVVDYELEVEAPSTEAGMNALKRVLAENGIEERKAPPKIARFFQQKAKLKNE